MCLGAKLEIVKKLSLPEIAYLEKCFQDIWLLTNIDTIMALHRGFVIRNSIFLYTFVHFSYLYTLNKLATFQLMCSIFNNILP